MSLATIRMARGLVAGWLAIAVLAFVSTPAPAQIGPTGIDHYLVYRLPAQPGGYPVVLRDQFLNQQPTTHVADHLDWFANPVDKNNEGMFDPELHYTWWHITPRPFFANIVATNQFGEQTIRLYDAEYLWNPALKNVPTPGALPPVANHYLCYRAEGPYVPRTVTLRDQFGQYIGIVAQPEWFCTPVEKNYQGVTEPPVRPDAHQLCYRVQVQNPNPVPHFITYLDEFRFGQADLLEQVWLCVPTLKHDVTDANTSSWGAVKAIYR